MSKTMGVFGALVASWSWPGQQGVIGVLVVSVAVGRLASKRDLRWEED